MSGILNSKERILDTIITQQGRKQISTGKLKPVFYSFSDTGTFYDKQDLDNLDIPFELEGRLMFEAASLPQDLICLEKDDSGKLIVKEFQRTSGSFVLINGQTYDTENQLFVSESASQQNSFLSGSLRNFINLNLLSEAKELDINTNSSEFVVSPNSVTFNITRTVPMSGSARVGSIDQIESLFEDKKLSHLSNFDFLPPVNIPRTGTTIKQPLGNFVDLKQSSILTLADLYQEITRFSDYMVSLNFLSTSKNNRIFSQFYEKSESSGIRKLDIIDFGEFEERNIRKHVFFAGKLYRDSTGSDTFVNMFTLIWKKELQNA
jgi:hypothetical protein